MSVSSIFSPNEPRADIDHETQFLLSFSSFRITFSYTYTANPTTTTVTSTAPLSTTTIVRTGYSDCNPNNYVNADTYTVYYDAAETIDAPDA